MILGMVPMALAMGEGGEQNAPLGRAVIGGLSGCDCRNIILRSCCLQRLAPAGSQHAARQCFLNRIVSGVKRLNEGNHAAD